MAPRMKLGAASPAWLVAAVVAVVVAGSIGLGVVPAAAGIDSRVQVVSLPDLGQVPDLQAGRGFLVGPDQVLVEVPGARFTRPLWVTPKPIPDALARETGIEVIYAGTVNTVFEASRDDAYRLLDRGYFIVEARFRPLADLTRPHFGRAITEALLAQRPLTSARQAFVRALAESVSTENLRSTIYYLNYDETLPAYRSRFAARHEMRQEVAPHLRDALTSLLVPNGWTVREQTFKPALPAQYRLDDSVMVNIIAEKPGRKTSARYVICAHYDSFAGATGGWNWLTDPAPGADDDASGAAAVLECARLLSGLNLDFGLTFIFFSGEELGLLGSDYYASSLEPGDSILAVLNFDMVAYGGNGPEISLVYDWKSKWLSDLMAAAAPVVDVTATVEEINLSGVANSDHSSFWTVGIPANMLIEGLDEGNSPTDPFYHTLADTLGTLDLDLAGDFVRLVTGWLGMFADVQGFPECDLELTDGSVEWRWEGRGFEPFIAGDTLTAVVRAVNVGGSMTHPQSYRFQIWQGESSAGHLVFSSPETFRVVSGGYAEVRATWLTSSSLYGEVPYSISLAPTLSGIESDLSNNTTVAFLETMSPGLIFRNLHVYPNPATDPTGASLAFEILLPENDFTGEMDVAVYSLEGRKLGGTTLKRSHIGDQDITVGRNSIALDDVLGGASDLPPGIYVCLAELRLVGVVGELTTQCKFAVAR